MTFNLFTNYTVCSSPGFAFKAEPPAIALEAQEIL